MALTVPKFIKTAFAAVGIKNNIPDASNNATGRAGYDKGFPAINMQPIEAGGIPPDGGDMNGVLYELSAAIQFAQSGVSFPYDQGLADSIGGYQIGAIVSDPANLLTLWVNGSENNRQYPSGWTQFRFGDPTESIRGTPFEATQAEVNLGSNVRKMVTPSKMTGAFGVGQTFSNDASSRYVSNVTYTNTKSKPVWVRLRAAIIEGRIGSASIYVDFIESAYSSFDSNSPIALNTLVPAGITWSFTMVNISSYKISVLE